MYTPLINADELALIYSNENIILIDAGAGPAAKTAYLEKHLPGALYMDVNTDLAEVKANAADGGRHPLPTPSRFAETLGLAGISNDSHVVVYDDKNGSNAAARLWWMLRSAGHEKVQVLNGGLQAAEKAGIPVTASATAPGTSVSYHATEWRWPQAGIDEVAAKAADKDYRVIDVRDAYRYKGESEPIDLVAGHIPGAINIPFSSNLNEAGLFHSPGVLKEKYKDLLKDIPSENIIVHCGSGVTACHTLLAMAHAGMDVPALYVGSWSEWSRNDRPVATGDK